MDLTLNSDSGNPRQAVTQDFFGGFTVLMAVYLKDNPQLFEQAVDSVFKNSLLPKELILVADGPLSEELEHALGILLKKYPDVINLLQLSKNVGLAGALNAGLKLVKTAWVVRADADDINLPMRFESLARLVRDTPGTQLVGSAILEVDSKGMPVAVRRVPEQEQDIRRFARSRNPFNHMSVAYTREAALVCGGYPNVYLKEDYALWCLMLANGTRVANTSEVLVRATAGRDMYRRRGGWRYARAEWDLQKLMVRSGLKSFPRGLLDGVLRAGVFLAPAWLRGWIYEKRLRTIPSS